MYADETYCRPSTVIPQQFVNGKAASVKYKRPASNKQQVGE